MTFRTVRLPLLVLLAAALVAGCASTSELSEEEGRKAAQYNARLGASYLGQGNLELANEKLQKALRQDDENVDAHVAYALLQMELGKPEKAHLHFREALSLAPDDPRIHNNYGTFLCNQGEYEEGIEQFLRAAENRLYSTPEYAFANAGACAVDAGLAQDARRYLRQALEISPRMPSALRELAQLEYDSGRIVSARKYLGRFHDAVKPTARTLLLATRVERRLGNDESADRYGRQLLRNFPDSDEAQRFLEER